MSPIGCETPRNWAIAAKTVWAALVDLSEIAKVKSFQPMMKPMIECRDDARGHKRHEHFAERLEQCGTVDLCGLFELPRDLAEERRERVDRQWQRERQV
jgi:hypothetical protein